MNQRGEGNHAQFIFDDEDPPVLNEVHAMRRSMIVFALFLSQLVYPQEKDSAVIFELKTKCMHSARKYCSSDRMSGGSFYDVKHNRCFAICTSKGNGFITTSLGDVGTGENLAIAVYGLNDPSGVKRSSWGVIGKKRTTYEKAMEYINRMTKEPLDTGPAKE